MSWAEEAGLQPDLASIEAVLAAECAPFAEDLVLSLVSALGFSFADGVDLLGHRRNRDDSSFGAVSYSSGLPWWNCPLAAAGCSVTGSARPQAFSRRSA